MIRSLPTLHLPSSALTAFKFWFLVQPEPDLHEAPATARPPRGSSLAAEPTRAGFVLLAPGRPADSDIRCLYPGQEPPGPCQRALDFESPGRGRGHRPRNRDRLVQSSAPASPGPLYARPVHCRPEWQSSRPESLGAVSSPVPTRASTHWQVGLSAAGAPDPPAGRVAGLPGRKKRARSLH